MTIQYEGVRFSDGSVAIRRISDDPCERSTRTFESVRECNEDLERSEVIRWLADAHKEAWRRSVEPARYEPTEDPE